MKEVRVRFKISENHLKSLMDVVTHQVLRRKVTEDLENAFSFNSWDEKSNAVGRKYPRISSLKIEVN